jgi:hypothetical protein
LYFPKDIVFLSTVEELMKLTSQIETSSAHGGGPYFSSVFTEHFSVEGAASAAIVRNLAGDTPAATAA